MLLAMPRVLLADNKVRPFRPRFGYNDDKSILFEPAPANEVRGLNRTPRGARVVSRYVLYLSTYRAPLAPARLGAPMFGHSANAGDASGLAQQAPEAQKAAIDPLESFPSIASEPSAGKVRTLCTLWPGHGAVAGAHQR